MLKNNAMKTEVGVRAEVKYVKKKKMLFNTQQKQLRP